MCARSAGGGVVPCWRQTTIGLSQISHSAIQQMSSSWYHGVMRAAAHSSQARSAIVQSDANGTRHAFWRETLSADDEVVRECEVARAAEVAGGAARADEAGGAARADVAGGAARADVARGATRAEVARGAARADVAR